MNAVEPLPTLELIQPALKPHIMLDLETLGNGNEAVILSIGAVKFTQTEIVDRFHVAIDPETCTAFGLKIDASTVMWWLDAERGAARAALYEHEQVDLPSALRGFADWVGNESTPMWGNGSTFDNVILRNAYRAIGMEYPVRFWHDWCYRTVKNLAPGIEIVREGTHHDALADAECQARHLQAILEHLGIEL